MNCFLGRKAEPYRKMNHRLRLESRINDGNNQSNRSISHYNGQFTRFRPYYINNVPDDCGSCKAIYGLITSSMTGDRNKN